MPLISVIIPTHNMAPWLDATLHSVLAQSLSDWECLVVDDGSTDNSVQCVLQYTDPRIHLIQQKNSGVSAARNRGMAQAQGEYIAFLDADDLWHPRALEWMLRPLQADPQSDLSWANFTRFEDGTGRIIPSVGTRLQHSGNAWLDLLVDNFMQTGAFCVRTKAAKQQLFDTSLVICEDRDWLLRILKNTKATYVAHTVHFYRQRTSSAVRDTQRFLIDENLVLCKHLADLDVPARVRRRALSALDFHAAILLAKVPHSWHKALKKYLEAILRDPIYFENYLRPFRKLFWKVCPKSYVKLP